MERNRSIPEWTDRETAVELDGELGEQDRRLRNSDGKHWWSMEYRSAILDWDC